MGTAAAACVSSGAAATAARRAARRRRRRRSWARTARAAGGAVRGSRPKRRGAAAATARRPAGARLHQNRARPAAAASAAAACRRRRRAGAASRRRRRARRRGRAARPRTARRHRRRRHHPQEEAAAAAGSSSAPAPRLAPCRPVHVALPVDAVDGPRDDEVRDVFQATEEVVSEAPPGRRRRAGRSATASTRPSTRACPADLLSLLCQSAPRRSIIWASTTPTLRSTTAPFDPVDPMVDARPSSLLASRGSRGPRASDRFSKHWSYIEPGPQVIAPCVAQPWSALNRAWLQR